MIRSVPSLNFLNPFCTKLTPLLTSHDLICTSSNSAEPFLCKSSAVIALAQADMQFQDTNDVLPCHIHLPLCFIVCKSWNLTAAKKNTSHGNRCSHKKQRISYKYHVTSEEVHAKIQQAIGLHEHLLSIVKRCRFLSSVV